MSIIRRPHLECRSSQNKEAFPSKEQNTRRKRKLLHFHPLILIFTCLCLAPYGCSMYLVRSGIKEIQILAGRVSIEKLVNDRKDSATVPLNKLIIVNSARNFSHQMGLRVGSIYTSVTDLGHDHLVGHLLTAIKAYDLRARATWWFPIIGTMPYKGFATLEEAEEEASAWEEDGYQTNIRDIEAFSTLGWFNDPVLSSFLTKPDRDLAKLLFHELSHATFWSGDVIVNESLAEFISIMLIESFYPQTQRLTTAIANNRSFKLGLEIEKLFQALDTDFQNGIYNSKDALFEKFNSKIYEELGVGNFFAHPNNAQLYDLYIYSRDYRKYLDKLISFDENPQSFIRWVKQTYKT